MSPMIFRKFHFRYLKPFGKWLTFHGSVQSFYYTTPLSDLDGVTKALYKTNMLQAFANCVTLEPFCAYVPCTGSTWVEKMCGTSFKSECVGKGWPLAFFWHRENTIIPITIIHYACSNHPSHLKLAKASPHHDHEKKHTFNLNMS